MSIDDASRDFKEPVFRLKRFEKEDPRIRLRRGNKARAYEATVKTFEKQGFRVYRRGKPDMIVEKNGKLMHIYIEQLNRHDSPVLQGPVDDLAQAYLRCYGIKTEVWGVQVDGVKENEWI